MNEDAFNMSIRKFLKTVGVTSQREIEAAVRDAIANGKLADGASVSVKATITIESLGISREIDGDISTG